MTMTEETETRTEEAKAAFVHTGHPTPLQYFKVAMILAVITAFEVGIFYVEDLGKGIIPVLVVLSSIKFGLVAMF